MVNAGELLQLEYTPDLAEAGIAYACQRGVNMVNTDLSRMFTALRQVVVDKIVELAFRRYLDRQGIAHQTVAVTGASGLDPYRLLVGGWHCILRAVWIDSPPAVQSVVSHPECLLQAGAVLPARQIIAWVPGEKDAYIFGFVPGLAAADQPAGNAATAHWMVLLSGDWSGTKAWGSLGKLEFVYQGNEPLQAAIGGRGDSLAPVREHLVFIPGERVISHQPFTALEYLHTAQPPTGSLNIYSAFQRRSHQVLPSAWKCLAYPGLTIYLAGFISHAEFARQSRRLDAGSHVYPGFLAPDKARILWVRELHPLSELIEGPRLGL